MKLGTIIKLPDGRIGTICWLNLYGCGGVFGECDFSHVDLDECGGFSDDIPLPEFMLREKKVEALLRSCGWKSSCHRYDLECVGEEYEIIRD